MSQTLLIVGTRKGVFILKSNPHRASWECSGPFCPGWDVLVTEYDETTSFVYAGGTSAWYGAAVWRSPDFGRSWEHSSRGMTFDDASIGVDKVWSLTAGDGRVYAGVAPAGLFVSEDHGTTWQEIPSLRRHPSALRWRPSNG
ncbi:MAG: exo-alpha-sialidase, partial [Gammaproteobacteria bacterium]